MQTQAKDSRLNIMMNRLNLAPETRELVVGVEKEHDSKQAAEFLMHAFAVAENPDTL